MCLEHALGTCSVISQKFLIKYYEYSLDYPIIITNQFTINAHIQLQFVPCQTLTYGIMLSS